MSKWFDKISMFTEGDRPLKPPRIEKRGCQILLQGRKEAHDAALEFWKGIYCCWTDANLKRKKRAGVTTASDMNDLKKSPTREPSEFDFKDSRTADLKKAPTREPSESGFKESRTADAWVYLITPSQRQQQNEQHHPLLHQKRSTLPSRVSSTHPRHHQKRLILSTRASSTHRRLQCPRTKKSTVIKRGPLRCKKTCNLLLCHRSADA